MGDKFVSSLIEPYELAKQLDDPNVRIIDATLFARLGENAEPIIESGVQHWQAGHIPGAHYVHPITEASDPFAELPAMAPTPAQFGALANRLGITKTSPIVIYSAEKPWWSTRLWWVFHIYGFKNVLVLNGGYAAWIEEGYPVSTNDAASFVSGEAGFPRKQLIAEREDVLKAVGKHDPVLINALEPSVFSGQEDPGYGRTGHISGSVNLPSSQMLDAQLSRFIASNEMDRVLARFVPDKATDVICYCGSGVAASIVVFCFHLCGYRNVRLYDAGLRDWVRDPNLPMDRSSAQASRSYYAQTRGNKVTDPSPSSSSDARRYDLDWLRVLAFGILIFYHIGMFYVSWGWHVKSTHAGPYAETLMLVVNPWRLALLFFISGVAIRFASDKAEQLSMFAASRGARLGLPIVFGMLVIVAPQAWLETVEKGEFTGGFLSFWPQYLQLEQSFSIVTPAWNHLWYVVYVLVYILLLAPFLPLLRRLSSTVIDRTIDFVSANPARLLLLTIVPFVFYEFVLTPSFPVTLGLVDDWANHAHRFTIFLLGFFVAKHNGFWAGIDRSLPLASGLVALLLLLRFWLQLDIPNAVTVVLGVLYAWAFLVMLLGAAQRWINRPSQLLSYLTAAVFCYYILHQTLIVVSGFFLTRMGLDVWTEFVLVLAVTVGGCAAGYEILRRVPGLRLFLGIQADRSRHAISAARDVTVPRRHS